ncbi:hypothetical protein [Rhizobium sp. ZPR3]|uniref:Uncharacterized protein n=2 Tax=unclassified Rhizobium TaxID=2613769 RepID=A0AAU7SFD5_9HYPH
MFLMRRGNSRAAGRASADRDAAPEQNSREWEYQKILIERAKLAVEKEKVANDMLGRRKEITSQYAFIALRSLLLINGAAAIAVFSFLGSAMKSTLGQNPQSQGALAQVQSGLMLADPLCIKYGCWCFGAGVFLSALSAMMAYISRYQSDALKPSSGARVCIGIAIGAGFFALGWFPAGVFYISQGIFG